MTTENQKLHCPECGSEEILAYEQTSFMVNTGEFYCHSVKAHDDDAKTRCMRCEWTGRRDQLTPTGAQHE